MKAVRMLRLSPNHGILRLQKDDDDDDDGTFICFLCNNFVYYYLLQIGASYCGFRASRSTSTGTRCKVNRQLHLKGTSLEHHVYTVMNATTCTTCPFLRLCFIIIVCPSKGQSMHNCA